ncbi:hypothetical protein Barb7_02191 [Bacteroidales bacterium Barb7]|nr:hypothetical protein Barb7_02191 [Bacteroidales bacterium Barb7]
MNYIQMEEHVLHYCRKQTASVVKYHYDDQDKLYVTKHILHAELSIFVQ